MNIWLLLFIAWAIGANMVMQRWGYVAIYTAALLVAISA